jgi:DNA-binding GntR family transcriptional regulator
MTFRTKQDYVAAALRDGILSGKYAPGQHLRQVEIADALKLSWTPVREAFRLLEAEGWVTVNRHRGAIVTPLADSDFEDIYELRLHNEPLAARLSAERMDPETLARLKSIYDSMTALDLADERNWPQLLRLERQFHDIQYSVIGRPRLRELVLNLRDASERYLRTYYLLPKERFQHGKTHAALLTAMRRRDGAGAEAALRAVLERVLVKMRPALKRGGRAAKRKSA